MELLTELGLRPLPVHIDQSDDEYTFVELALTRWHDRDFARQDAESRFKYLEQ